MSFVLPELRISAPMRSGVLSVFALHHTEPPDGVDYMLGDDAIADGSAIVQEISDTGSIRDVTIRNSGSHSVLFIEGDQLVGGKQNRVINSSVLVPCNTRLTVPVTCVEKGRWTRTTRHFAPSGHRSPSRLRRVLKQSVADSLHRGQGRRSDQVAVWNEIRELQDKHGVVSKTRALSDAYEEMDGLIASLRTQLPYVEGASGMAAAVGNRLLGLDLFDKPTTCKKVWDRLLTGFAFDACDASTNQSTLATRAHVGKLLAHARRATWLGTPRLGDGNERRTQFDGTYASALTIGGTIVHLVATV